MADMVPYFVFLLLFLKGALSTGMVSQQDNRKSGWNNVNGMSKTNVLSDSMLLKSTKESKKVPFAADDMWNLLLGMKETSSRVTKPKSKAETNPSGLNRLQILTKSSTFLPGLSFLKTEKKSATNDKTVRNQLKPSKSNNQTAERNILLEGGEIVKTRSPETTKTKTIRINENEIEQVFNSLQDQTFAPTTLPPLEGTTGYKSAMWTTTIGNLLGFNFRLLKSFGKQIKAVKTKTKFEMKDQIKTHKTKTHVADQVFSHPGEPVEMMSPPEVTEQQIRTQSPKLVVNMKPTSKVKRHIDPQDKVQMDAYTDQQPNTFSASSTDLIKGDVKGSPKQSVKSQDLQINHPGTSSNSESIYRQRTVDFMDPYTLEQQMLKKAKMKSKPLSSVHVNSIQPKSKVDLFKIQSIHTPMNSKFRTIIPSPKSVNVKSNGGQGHRHGWHGNNGLYHVGSRVTSKSRLNSHQHSQHRIPLRLKKKFVKRKGFNIKQIPQPSSNFVKTFGNKRNNHSDLKRLLRELQARKYGLHYNFIKNALKFSQSLISDRNQAGSIFKSRMHKSTAVRPLKEWKPYNQLSPGDVPWNYSGTRRRGKQQSNSRQQSRKQVGGSTTSMDWLSQRQELTRNVTPKRNNNRHTGHQQQHNGGQRLQEMQWKVKQISQSLPNDIPGESYPNLEQQEKSYLPQDFTQQLSDSKSQNNHNVEQYGRQEQQHAQSNFNKQWNEGNTLDLNQNPSFDANIGQIWADGTDNTNERYVVPDANYQPNIEHNIQQGEQQYDSQTYQDQQSLTNFQMQAGLDIYSNVETQDPVEPHILGLQEAFSLSNNEDDSEDE